MADSLSTECTPLKRDYDGCFNSWFEARSSSLSRASDRPGLPRCRLAHEAARRRDGAIGGAQGQRGRVREALRVGLVELQRLPERTSLLTAVRRR